MSRTKGKRTKLPHYPPLRWLPLLQLVLLLLPLLRLGLQLLAELHDDTLVGHVHGPTPQDFSYRSSFWPHRSVLSLNADPPGTGQWDAGQGECGAGAGVQWRRRAGIGAAGSATNFFSILPILLRIRHYALFKPGFTIIHIERLTHL
jgi:hypothetical protein